MHKGKPRKFEFDLQQNDSHYFEVPIDLVAQSGGGGWGVGGGMIFGKFIQSPVK